MFFSRSGGLPLDDHEELRAGFAPGSSTDSALTSISVVSEAIRPSCEVLQPEKQINPSEHLDLLVFAQAELDHVLTSQFARHRWSTLPLDNHLYRTLESHTAGDR